MYSGESFFLSCNFYQQHFKIQECKIATRFLAVQVSSLELKIVLNFGSFLIILSISICVMLNMRSLPASEEFH